MIGLVMGWLEVWSSEKKRKGALRFGRWVWTVGDLPRGVIMWALAAAPCRCLTLSCPAVSLKWACPTEAISANIQPVSHTS